MFSIDMNRLSEAPSMFNSCSSLTTFKSSLNLLTSASSMFYNCKNLTSFSAPTPVLSTATSMFSGCSSLTSFESSSTKLKDVNYMFSGCSSLTTFNGSFASVTKSAYNTFRGCKLNKESVANIANSIALHIPPMKLADEITANVTENGKTVKKIINGIITIHVDSSMPQEDLQEVVTSFNIISEKGWTVETNIPYSYIPPTL